MFLLLVIVKGNSKGNCYLYYELASSCLSGTYCKVQELASHFCVGTKLSNNSVF